MSSGPLKASKQAAAGKGSSLMGSGILGEYVSDIISQPKSGSASGTCNINSQSNGVSLTPSTQQMQANSICATSSAVQSDTTTQLLPTLLPPIPPPPVLPPALAVAAAAAVAGGTTQPFVPSYVQFQTSPTGPYYFQQQSSATPPLPVPSSTNYNTSLNAHSKASGPNDFQQGYMGSIATPSVSGTTPNNSSNNTTMFQLLTSTSSSMQAEATTTYQQPTSVMSPQMMPPMFSHTIMTIPPSATASLSSINGNINETVTPIMSSNTPLSSVNYNVNQHINSATPSQETDQSFSTDNHNGLPLQQHLPTSYNSSNICQTQNAIQAPYYTTECDIPYPLYNNTEQVSLSGNNIDCNYKAVCGNGGPKIQKEKRGISTLVKNNLKKFSSSSLVTKNNRNCPGKNKSEVENPRVGENSDGYTSSVSHSSTRFSSHRRSTSSSATSPNKISKGTSTQQPTPLYQKQSSPKQKQQKCQSLDRSSDSDFNSHVSGSSKNKEITSSMTTCDLCKLTFPSQSVLDNHLKGSRHARRVKSQQAFRQLQDNGTNLRQNIIHEDGTIDEELHYGEICCEVCEVSVNSSHQLQAHLAGNFLMFIRNRSSVF